jgi:hypothetical protein
MLSKKLDSTHLNRPLYAAVKGEFEVRGVLVGFEPATREKPREVGHPLMGSVVQEGIQLHIGNRVYFMADDASDKVLVFL